MKCGFYETEITPHLGSMMPGYHDGRAGKGVKLRLYAKAAVMENNGTYVAFLSIDALCLPHGFADAVKKRVQKFTPIPADNLVLAATHTHTGPPNRDDLGDYKYTPIMYPGGLPLDPEMDKITMQMIELRAADAIILAYQRLQEVNIYYGKGKAEGIAYVRNHMTKSGEIRTNPGWDIAEYAMEKPDESVPVFFVTTKEDDEPLGLITSFSTHHDTVQGDEYSSDYSGYMAKSLKEDFGMGFVTVFFSGFNGNTNHYNYYNPKAPKTRPAPETAAILKKAVMKTIMKAELIEDDCLSVIKDTTIIKKRSLDPEFVEELKEIAANPPQNVVVRIDQPETLKYARAFGLLERYVYGSKTEYEIPVMVVKIGDCLIYSVVGENFSPFARMIYEGSPTEKNLLIGLAHDGQFAYIPTEDLFLPYVYESSISSACLEEKAGYKIVDKATELGNKIYK